LSDDSNKGDGMWAELNGFIDRKQKTLLQALPKPEATVCARILPTIIRVSPTSKTAHQIISGIINELTSTSKQ
jgi:hypothetical protein